MCCAIYPLRRGAGMRCHAGARGPHLTKKGALRPAVCVR